MAAPAPAHTETPQALWLPPLLDTDNNGRYVNVAHASRVTYKSSPTFHDSPPAVHDIGIETIKIETSDFGQQTGKSPMFVTTNYSNHYVKVDRINRRVELSDNGICNDEVLTRMNHLLTTYPDDDMVSCVDRFLSYVRGPVTQSQIRDLYIGYRFLHAGKFIETIAPETSKASSSSTLSTLPSLPGTAGREAGQDQTDNGKDIAVPLSSSPAPPGDEAEHLITASDVTNLSLPSAPETSGTEAGLKKSQCSDATAQVPSLPSSPAPPGDEAGWQSDFEVIAEDASPPAAEFIAPPQEHSDDDFEMISLTQMDEFE